MQSHDLWPDGPIEFDLDEADGMPCVVITAHDGGIGKARWLLRFDDFLRFAAMTNEFAAQQLKGLARFAAPD
jgi:hypothetical protein